jgi:hypothetical protein
MAQQPRPGTFSFYLQNLRKIYDEAKVDANFETKARDAEGCWYRVERIINALFTHSNIRVDPQRLPSGAHSWHEALLQQLDNPATPAAIRDALGGGQTGIIMSNCKTYRNRYGEYMAGAITQGELQKHLETFMNGLPLIIKPGGPLETACVKSKVMDTIM